MDVKMSCFVQMCQMEWLLALWSARCSASSWSSWLCGSSLTPSRNTSTERWKRPRATRWSETEASRTLFCLIIMSSLIFLSFVTFNSLSVHQAERSAGPGSLWRRCRGNHSRQPPRWGGWAGSLKEKNKKTAGATSEQQEVRDVQASTCVILKGNQWDGANVWRLKCFLNLEGFCSYHWSNL